MNYTIRQFTSADYSLIKSWWNMYDQVAPELEFIPTTTYIMYFHNEPILSMSLILTNTPIGWFENYIGNPSLKGDIRKKGGNILYKYLTQIAKAQGKTRIFCMSIHDKTTKRYTEFGMQQTATNVTTLTQEVD